MTNRLVSQYISAIVTVSIHHTKDYWSKEQKVKRKSGKWKERGKGEWKAGKEGGVKM